MALRQLTFNLLASESGDITGYLRASTISAGAITSDTDSFDAEKQFQVSTPLTQRVIKELLLAEGFDPRFKTALRSAAADAAGRSRITIDALLSPQGEGPVTVTASVNTPTTTTVDGFIGDAPDLVAVLEIMRKSVRR